MTPRFSRADVQGREGSVPSTTHRHQSLRSTALRLALLLVGGVASLWLLPAHTIQGDSGAPVPSQATHASGGAAQPSLPVLTPTCGHPKAVFQALGLPLDKVPDPALLRQLPTPQQRPAVNQGDVTYDPAKDELCAVGYIGLYVRYVNPQPTVPGSTTFQPDSSWVQHILDGLIRSSAQGISTFFKSIIDWATSFGFMFVTPKTLTYDHEVVKNLHAWVLSMLDGVVFLVLVITGYQMMLGYSRSFRELAPRLIVAAIAANFSLYIITQCIELHNALCLGVQSALASAGVGNLSLPWGAVNWLTAPEYELITYLLETLVTLLLSLQMLARIALLDLLIILAPLGIMCFALPQTQAWGRLWAQAFVATLIVQFLQVLCIGMGSALVASFGHSSLTVVTILVGVAALFLAFKIPGMLLTNVLQASTGGNRTMTSTLVNAVTSFAEYLGALAPLV